MSGLLTRLRFFFRRKSSGELDEELQFHLEQATQANIAAGMTHEEAHREAVIAFGGVEARANSPMRSDRVGGWRRCCRTFAMRYADSAEIPFLRSRLLSRSRWHRGIDRGIQRSRSDSLPQPAVCACRSTCLGGAGYLSGTGAYPPTGCVHVGKFLLQLARESKTL